MNWSFVGQCVPSGLLNKINCLCPQPLAGRWSHDTSGVFLKGAPLSFSTCWSIPRSPSTVILCPLTAISAPWSPKMANPCSRRCGSLSTERTVLLERCHCGHFWNVSLPSASGLCGGTPLPRVHVWWHDEDQDVALQHQTTQGSPAEEHFGDACKSPL